MDSSKLPRFKTKEEKKEYLDKLEFWEQEEYQETKEDYQKFSHIIRKDLVVVYGILETLCYISLRSWLEAEPEYERMMKDNLFNTITLHKLVQKICNGSTCIIVEDVIGNTMECMYAVMLLKGDDFDSLLMHLEAA